MHRAVMGTMSKIAESGVAGMVPSLQPRVTAPGPKTGRLRSSPTSTFGPVNPSCRMGRLGWTGKASASKLVGPSHVC